MSSSLNRFMTSGSILYQILCIQYYSCNINFRGFRGQYQTKYINEYLSLYMNILTTAADPRCLFV